MDSPQSTKWRTARRVARIAGQAQLDLGPAVCGQDVTASIVGLSNGVPSEPKGVIYTRAWVVDLILDLGGYRSTDDLAARYAVEPSAGEGAFLVPMVRRLLRSVSLQGRSLADARTALQAYELDEASAARAMALVTDELEQWGATSAEAKSVARGWVTVGDYLVASREDRPADLVVGNPPYIRYDDLPAHLVGTYRQLYPTMVGRCDIYVGFIEAGIRQLTAGGALAFICADRWMRSAYGAQLRYLVTERFGVEAVIEMHNAPAFENDVAAYPAVIVIRRGLQGEALVASAGAKADALPDGKNLAEGLGDLAARRIKDLDGFKATRVDRWFRGKAPWPSLEPARLVLLQQLEARFAPLEDLKAGTKVGIGVATGADAVYVTTDESAVERERLLPLAMAGDTKTGTLKWSGHFLVDPWEVGRGLVNLSDYPRLQTHFERHRSDLVRRNIAKRNDRQWYRTIDRVDHELTGRPKLYVPDMKMFSNPTLDRGETYPHHNLYYLTSRTWDLEVLGGLLLSRVAQLFVEAYCVKMRGGTLRFQAQYLRRIRVPDPATLSDEVRHRLIGAFRSRDAEAATMVAIEAYGLSSTAEAFLC